MLAMIRKVGKACVNVLELFGNGISVILANCIQNSLFFLYLVQRNHSTLLDVARYVRILFDQVPLPFGRIVLAGNKEWPCSVCMPSPTSWRQHRLIYSCALVPKVNWIVWLATFRGGGGKLKQNEISFATTKKLQRTSISITFSM